MEKRIVEEIDLSYATLHYVKPVVHIVFKENAELGFLEIRELTFYAQKLSDRHPYFTFSDATVDINITPQGRKVAADGKEAPFHRGSAVLVKAEMMKLAANFFGSINGPSFPFRVFTDKEKAMRWLLQLPLN
jgi:hypothetical protein